MGGEIEMSLRRRPRAAEEQRARAPRGECLARNRWGFAAASEACAALESLARGT